MPLDQQTATTPEAARRDACAPWARPLATGVDPRATVAPRCSPVGASAPAPRLLDIVEAFGDRAVGEDLAARAEPWGDKLGHSVYDEEEVLGQFLPMCVGHPDEDVYDWGDDDEEDEEDEDDDDYDDYDDNEDYLDQLMGATRVDPYTLGFGELPRLVRQVKPLCLAYRLEADLRDECAVCLSALAAGDQAWRLPCTHVFHESCAIRLLAMRRARATCPVCRCDIKSAAGASLGGGLASPPRV